VWPGTSWVKEFAMAIMGLPNISRFMPLAIQRALAPAILLPSVHCALRNLFFMTFYIKKPFSINEKGLLFIVYKCTAILSH
jgi:hypothetical protein